MVKPKKAAQKKTRKKDWRLLAGVRPPVESEHPEMDITETLVCWLNAMKGLPRQVVVEHIRKLKAGDESSPEDVPMQPSATAERLRMSAFVAELVPLQPRTTAESLRMCAFVTELHEWGALDRLRVCATCKAKWIFIRHSNYKFCSNSCRRSSYWRSESGKEKARLRQRENRAWKKKLKEITAARTAKEAAERVALASPPRRGKTS
jgi:hypothetical protein